MMNVYEFTSYSKYLVALTRTGVKSYTVSSLAQFAGVQRPYLSNVLANRAHLSTEQGYKLADKLGFDSEAQTYFSLLIEHERAADQKFKNYLMTKIKKQQSSALKLENRLERPLSEFQQAITAEYFSAWEFCALHILSSIPSWQKPAAMAEALRVPKSFVLKILARLEEWGLVRHIQGRYEWASGNVHIPADSAVLTMHHRNWREKSIEDARQRAGETIHFTSVYSISQNDYEKFRLHILNFLKDYNHTAGQSKEEKLICFNLDYFDLT